MAHKEHAFPKSADVQPGPVSSRRAAQITRAHFQPPHMGLSQSRETPKLAASLSSSPETNQKKWRPPEKSKETTLLVPLPILDSTPPPPSPSPCPRLRHGPGPSARSRRWCARWRRAPAAPAHRAAAGSWPPRSAPSPWNPKATSTPAKPIQILGLQAKCFNLNTISRQTFGVGKKSDRADVSVAHSGRWTSFQPKAPRKNPPHPRPPPEKNGRKAPPICPGPQEQLASWRVQTQNTCAFPERWNSLCRSKDLARPARQCFAHDVGRGGVPPWAETCLNHWP